MENQGGLSLGYQGDGLGLIITLSAHLSTNDLRSSWVPGLEEWKPRAQTAAPL